MERPPASSIRLRPATEADLRFLRRVQRAAMRPHVERVYGAWDDAKQRDRFGEATDHAVVELDGRAVGCQRTRAHPDALELLRLYLLPEVQGRGIGTHLVRRLLAEARRRGLRVRLRVLRGNRARRLYERLGFAVVRTTETHDYMECAP